MTIKRFTAQRFRCLADVELEPAPHYTLIYGANASGKTSLLEALAYLGRGKSFRGAPPSTLIQHGEQEFVLFGQVDAGGRLANVGVRNSRSGLEVRVDGDSSGGAAALAETLPLQVIDQLTSSMRAALAVRALRISLYTEQPTCSLNRR